ncbi:MAG: PKD domain-containing protein [Bacteroidia bacterium]|nr:PKD domain-containing protein [Bacteroidia bacterium]
MILKKQLLLCCTLVIWFSGIAVAGGLPDLTNKATTAELTERRDRNSKHFKNSDGTCTMITSAGSLHYRSENGQWLDINTDIKPTKESDKAGYGFANTENSFKSYFPYMYAAKGVLTIMGNNKILEGKKSGYYFESNEGKSSMYDFNTGTASVNGNTVLFPSATGEADIRYTVQADQRKLDWVLNNRNLINKAPAQSKWLVIYESIKLPEGWSILAKGDVMNVYDASGQHMIQYEKPMIYELASPSADRTEDDFRIFGTYRLVSNNNEWYIETMIDLEWLRAKDRIYPVIVDPTASYYPTNTNFWTGYQTSSTSKTNGMMRVTNGLNVGWSKFNISSLPAAAIVSQTVLNSYHYTTTGTKDALINDMNATDPVSAAAATISSAIAANDSYISNYPYGGSTYGWRSGTLGASANSDMMARRSQGWTALGFAYSSGSTTFMYHYGWNGTYPPYLSITYLDAIIDASVTALVSPAGNSCGNSATNIIVRVKNNSASDSVTGLRVVCNITGTFNLSLSGILNRKLYAGTEDTIALATTFNTLSGANLQFTIYTDYGNDPNHSNDTLNISRIINGVPSGMVINHHASSKGTFKAGTFADPDHVKAADSLVYELLPPSGFTSGQYGTDWNISLISIRTAGLTNLSNFYQTISGSGNQLLVLKPQQSETDSIYEIDITYRVAATGCDSTKERWVYIAPVPVVNFTCDTVCFGFPSDFQNTTTLLHETPLYRWDFGDAGSADTSDQTHPLYTYSNPGNFNVTLTATSSLGYTVTYTKTVTVLHRPFTVFNFTSACDGEAVVFTNQSTIGGSSTTPLSYYWTLGDGTYSVATNTSKTYASFGSYQVKLKAISQYGCSDSITKTVRVHERPDVSFTAINSCAGQSTQFSNSTTISAGLIGYSWDFGDGTNSQAKSPFKVYATPGTYAVKLLAISDFGCPDSLISNISVYPSPVASFTASSSFCSNDSVTLLNTSTVSGGGQLTYKWLLGNGDSSASNAASFKQYYGIGSFDITLEATTTNNCTAQMSKNIVVNEAPKVSFTTTSPLCEKNDVVFNNGSSLQNGVLTYQWNFQSGGNSTQTHPVVKFLTAGINNIKLTATSDKNCVDSFSQSINIRPTPDASFSMLVLSPQKRQVTLTPGNASYYGYEWQMGDGTVSNQVSPVYSYLTNGIFKITLKVTDINMCENTSDTSVMFSVGTGDLNNQNAVVLYPVPADKTLFIECKSTQPVNGKWQISDASGKNILSADFSGKTEVSTTDIAPGIYFIRILVNEQETNKKLIITH